MDRIICCCLFSFTALANLLVSFQCLSKKSRKGRMLGFSMLFSALVSISYLISIMTKNYFVMSLSSSIYFCFIDCMLLFLLRFFYAFLDIDTSRVKSARCVLSGLHIWSSIDILILLSNPFHEKAITYAFHNVGNSGIASWVFEPHPFYTLHLLLCYLIIGYGFILIFMNVFRISYLYRNYYLRIIFSVLFVVIINAAYLLQLTERNIDYSVLLYSLFGYVIYWNTLVRGDRNLLNQARQIILDHSSQPLFLFDDNDRLILSNQAARTLLPSLAVSEDSPRIRDFIGLCGMETLLPSLDEETRFYWTEPNGEHTSYICDFQLLRDKKQRIIARFFIFTNNMLGIDSLTGFQTEHYFSLHRKELSSSQTQPVGAAVCNLNRLSLLNNTIGQSCGDEAIALQAKVMKKHLPANTVFIRLQDANLCAVCYGLSKNEIKKRMKDAAEQLQTYSQFPFRLKIDFAVCMLDETNDVMDAAGKAISILRTRKVLDSESDRSSAIESLRQMLIECDPETEGHVQRTRLLGDSLAYRIGLTDYERDQLSLLCLFHDIGKVGIPLHILNKPGPLTDEEWIIMRGHVEKGYRIARATPELNIVAEPILHHHEYWNGNGYPDGQQSEAIPLLSRIISVVDAYDAMVTDRSYRKGITSEAACAELVRCSGIQFDPYIVDVFVRMLENGKSHPSETTCETIHPENIAEKEGSKETAPAKTVLVNPVRYSQYFLNDKEVIEQVDENFEQLTGYTIYDIRNLSLTQNDLLFEEDKEIYWKMVNDMVGHAGIVYLEHRIRRKDGTGRYVYCTGIPGTDPASGKKRSTIIVSDITDSISVQLQIGQARNRAMMSLRRLEESIQKDPMTGLLNRAAFRKNCERELSGENSRSVLMMMDVDHFKDYNDTFGHPKGDELLLCLTGALTSAIRQDDLAGRMGGDEFCCLLRLGRNATLEDIHRRTSEVFRSISRALTKLPTAPTLSAGAACSSPNGSSFRGLYDAADKELYTAKKRGKNQLSIQNLKDLSDEIMADEEMIR